MKSLGQNNKPLICNFLKYKVYTQILAKIGMQQHDLSIILLVVNECLKYFACGF